MALISMLETLDIKLSAQASFLLGLGLTGGAIAALVFHLRRHKKAPTEPDLTIVVPDKPADTAMPRWPEATLPVLDFDALVAISGTAIYLERTRQDCGLNERTWSDFILPVIRNVAELVQQLPASESHHHAHPGGLWIHTCETMRHAVRLRQGVVLPSGRDAEDQSKHRHRWTAGVIVATLLHDIGKTVTDLTVRLYGQTHRGVVWNALAGDMRASQATDYAVDFPRSSERDYKAHQRDGVLLMQRLVPSQTMVWIGEDPPLLDTLIQYLAGESAGTDNPIAALVSAAERESVRMNLLEGPRTRFSSARAIPLIERLMDALRRMLAEGGQIPLNRPGAAGYVFDGDVWFAAARLANSVRDYLRINESSIGIPGEDKNDRLFDVWQDYGACRTNPDSGRALWGGRIEFDGGITGYDLPSMLRFPLDRLYPDKALYPANLAGRIIPIEIASSKVDAEKHAGDQPPVKATPVPAPIAPVPQPQTTAPNNPVPANRPAPDDSASGADNKISVPATKVEVTPPLAVPPSPTPDTPPVSASRISVPVNESPDTPATPIPAAAEFLDEQDSATRADLASSEKAAKPAQTASLRPVAPAIPLPTIPGKQAKPAANGPSSEAIEFMTWVQNGISGGTLPYNVPGALIHFVKHKDECGMLLVSPLIFRRFAEERGFGTEAGLSVQRSFSGAGWHVRGSGGKNVVSYQVMRKGERGGNLLNGFLVLQPERFFNPVPNTNDRLVFWNTDPALSMREKK